MHVTNAQQIHFQLALTTWTGGQLSKELASPQLVKKTQQLQCIDYSLSSRLKKKTWNNFQTFKKCLTNNYQIITNKIIVVVTEPFDYGFLEWDSHFFFNPKDLTSEN